VVVVIRVGAGLCVVTNPKLFDGFSFFAKAVQNHSYHFARGEKNEPWIGGDTDTVTQFDRRFRNFSKPNQGPRDDFPKFALKLTQFQKTSWTYE
jgi:hypothetical protein